MVSPLPIYLPETLQFRAAPKNAVHFLYGAVLHRPGGTPGPLSLFCATALCKAAKSAAFCGCLPVSALECFSAFETGIFFRGFG